MKKRMKLTEKELAIGMWLYIKSRIANRDDDPPTLLKSMYLCDHDYHMLGKWSNFCILCHKHNVKCSECPLISCSNFYKTPWSIVAKFDTRKHKFQYTLEERLEACDKIIEAIRNAIPDDYKS